MLINQSQAGRQPQKHTRGTAHHKQFRSTQHQASHPQPADAITKQWNHKCFRCYVMSDAAATAMRCDALLLRLR